MKNKIQINLGTDHTLECTEKVIGRAGEGLVSRLEIAVPDALSSYDAYIDFEKPNGETFRTPKLEVDYGVAHYDVPQYLLVENGEIKVQLVFEKSNGKVWKSSKKRYTILKSINAVDDIPEKVDFLADVQKLIDELSQEVGEIADILANDTKFAQAVIDACGGQTKITTINGIALRFFVGDQAEFDALSEPEKLNLFAIITDDTAKERMLEEIRNIGEHAEENEAKIEGVIDDKPYFLNGLKSNNARYITSASGFDISTLRTFQDLGVYVFSSAFFVGALTGFPAEYMNATGGKLIVEADTLDSYGTPTNVYQTLKVAPASAIDDPYRITIYHRAYRSGGWTPWQRYVSAEELESGTVSVKKA